MGCFSFLCSTCEEPLNSDSFSGEHCTLFLMEKGLILEWMQGQYDSYGRVFDDARESVEWASRDWSMLGTKEHSGANVCDLMSSSDSESGLAAYHTECLEIGKHPIVSDHDPEQGWGDYKYTTQGPHRHEVPRDNGIITLPPGEDGITWTKAG